MNTPVARRWWLLPAALILAVALTVYVARARTVQRELRDGLAAYDALCARTTASSQAAGSPGSIAHLVSALQVELDLLAQRYPRWHAAYVKDPGAYPCGPQEPNTRVGSES